MKTYTIRYYKAKSDFPHKLTNLVIEAPSLVEMFVHLIQMQIPMYSLFYSYQDFRGHRHSFARCVYDYACFQLKCVNYYHLSKDIIYEES